MNAEMSGWIMKMLIIVQAGLVLGASLVFLWLYARQSIYHHVVAEALGVAMLMLLAIACAANDVQEPRWSTWTRWVAFVVIDYGIISVFRAKWKEHVSLLKKR